MSLPEVIAMTTSEQKEKYSDEELEEIIDMHASNDVFSATQLRETIRENPLLTAGLIFTFGILVGVALSSRHGRPH
jgi:hypothetical protein